MELYNYIKSLHLIFIITWFAGLFYIVRLFVYQIEANEKPSPEREILLAQYKIMTYRLWFIITWPSAVLATIFALWLLFLMPGWLLMPWMQVKLGFVVLLLAYHLKCHQIYSQLQNDQFKYSSNFMRLWNEGATIILFSVVFLVILKNAFNWIYGVIGIILFSVLIMLGFKFYKRIREK
ncbi:CopD family protein [Flavobacterium macrobrachii]|uniref:Protoporphyrinogen IX oxidase n=1 Tax=Flavobacterium macrobrachii TaxID=591204 RepID=A0ABS2D385_9FLAO|nr:CopD family protein [Flavobacterium macrobrachii]MBM6500892.1 CopD family protein [Flavobacterium macrobrachii]PZO29320.1 MAG: protoporphyrinogen IX oxidase [Flavobacteriaceae bacterium]